MFSRYFVFLSISIFLSGCTISYTHKKSVNFGFSHYARLENTDICYGYEESDVQSVRMQVRCDYIPEKYEVETIINNNNEYILIDGYEPFKPSNGFSTYYNYKTKRCIYKNHNSKIESNCRSNNF